MLTYLFLQKKLLTLYFCKKNVNSLFLQKKLLTLYFAKENCYPFIFATKKLVLLRSTWKYD